MVFYSFAASFKVNPPPAYFFSNFLLAAKWPYLQKIPLFKYCPAMHTSLTLKR
jgi:hypothetical protein